MDQEDFFQEAVNRHLSNSHQECHDPPEQTPDGDLVVLAVVVGSWVIYHAIQNPGASPF